ncbi:MAG: hypothetical protein WBV85_07390 [Solirubrobacteraceae bacterium]
MLVADAPRKAAPIRMGTRLRESATSGKKERSDQDERPDDQGGDHVEREASPLSVGYPTGEIRLCEVDPKNDQ